MKKYFIKRSINSLRMNTKESWIFKQYWQAGYYSDIGLGVRLKNIKI